MAIDKNVCPLCGGETKRETREQQTTHKDVPYSYEQPGVWCLDCGEGFLSPKDLQISSQLKKNKKREIDISINGA